VARSKSEEKRDLGQRARKVSWGKLIGSEETKLEKSKVMASVVK
jgi:hypothetical protein